MEIKLIHIIIDDEGNEIHEGDKVILKSKEMEDSVEAVVNKIMTTMVVFISNDPLIGHKPIRLFKNDITSITLYKKRKT